MSAPVASKRTATTRDAGDQKARRSLRLLYVTERMPYGSGETFIIPEIQSLLVMGHDVTIVPFSMASVVHTASVQDLLPRVASVQLLSARTWRRILRAAARRPHKAVQAIWDMRASRSLKQLALNLIAALKGFAIADIVRESRAEHVHAHWANYTATAALVSARLTGRPWSITAHRYDIVANNLLRQKLSESSFVRFISESGRRLAAALVREETPSAKVVVHLGVPISAAPELPKAGCHASVILCVARLIPVKGLEYLIDAMAQLRDRRFEATLVLVGDGPLAESLRARVRRHEIADHVRMPGAMTRDEVFALYASGEVACVVLPSLDLGNGLQEGIPVSLMEAMSFRIPAVATSTGGTPELLGGGAGILVEQRNAKALADSLEYLLTNHIERRSIAEAGCQRVMREFNSATTTAILQSMFLDHSQLLASGTAGRPPR